LGLIWWPKRILLYDSEITYLSYTCPTMHTWTTEGWDKQRPLLWVLNQSRYGHEVPRWIPFGNLTNLVSWCFSNIQKSQVVLEHEFYEFHFRYGMSSETHWRTPSFFKMGTLHHQPDDLIWAGRCHRIQRMSPGNGFSHRGSLVRWAVLKNAEPVDDSFEDPTKQIWLVVWNMAFMTFHIFGRIIPTDELTMFRGVGRYTTNQKSKQYIGDDHNPSGELLPVYRDDRRFWTQLHWHTNWPALLGASAGWTQLNW
jgi:hypothetical protein